MIGQQRKQRPSRWIGWAVSLIVFAFIVICAKPPPDEIIIPTSASSSSSKLSSSASAESSIAAKGNVLVKCDLLTPFDDRNENESSKGTLQITVHRNLAPLASNAFLDMIKSHHFDRNYLFRVVKGFIVQWGIASPPRDGDKTKFPKVDLDPPPTTNADKSIRSNVRGTLNFAGGNSGTGQVYINRGNASRLDKDPGSLPFATLDERSMAIVDSVFNYKEGLGQVKAVHKGDDEVKKLFPRMSRIEKCWIAAAG